MTLFRIIVSFCGTFRLYRRRRKLLQLSICSLLFLGFMLYALMLVRVSHDTSQAEEIRHIDELTVRLEEAGRDKRRFESPSTREHKDVVIRNGSSNEDRLTQERNLQEIHVGFNPNTGRIEKNRKKNPWKEFLGDISLDEMYSYSAAYMPDLLHYLSTAKIVNVTYLNIGTQVKLAIRFEDGNKAIAKPMRHPRDFYWAYNKSQPFWLDEERHTAEIAAFHLDRILNYRRVIPCVGRKVNFPAEILNNTNDPAILKTLEKINGTNCFIGDCVPWFCNREHMLCDRDDVMELAVCQRIPGGMPGIAHPWYQGTGKAKGWKSKNICTQALLNHPEITESRFFLDLMELALFDHLIVNYDRHHVAVLDHKDRKRSFVITHDNGKGFGNPYKNDVTFLAPIYQCCRFRNSTYQHILSLTKNNNTRLGDLMKRSLSQDPLAPILTDPFFPTLDRRLADFYFVMSKCIEAHGAETVLSENFTYGRSAN